MAINLFQNDFIRFKRDGKDVSILVQRDEYPDNPRNWDNLGRMICFHNCYRLGDEHSFKTQNDFLVDLVQKTMSPPEVAARIRAGETKIEAAVLDDGVTLMEHWKDWQGDEQVEAVATGENTDQATLRLWMALDLLEDSTLWSLIDPDRAAILPVYLLDHSGLTVSTASFCDPWDSGQVGWIYVTCEKFLKETGYTKAQWPGRAIEMLNNEVKTYDQYLTGDVYGFQEFELDEDGDWIETENSCWGFYGCDIEENGIVDDVPGLAEAIASGDYETGNATIHSSVSYTYEF